MTGRGRIGEYGLLAALLALVATQVASACTTTGTVATNPGAASGSQVASSAPATSAAGSTPTTRAGAGPLAVMVGTFSNKFAAVGCAIGDTTSTTTTAKWAWNHVSSCPDMPTIDPFSIVSSVTITEGSIEVQVPTRASTCTGTPTNVRADGASKAALTMAEVRCGGEAAPDVDVTFELKGGDLYANGKRFTRAGTTPGSTSAGTAAPSAPRSKFSAVASAIQ